MFAEPSGVTTSAVAAYGVPLAFASHQLWSGSASAQSMATHESAVSVLPYASAITARSGAVGCFGTSGSQIQSLLYEPVASSQKPRQVRE